MNFTTYNYILLPMMLNIKNIFLTTSLSFLLGFYSVCHLLIYIKRIEDIGSQNRNSFDETHTTINEYEYKYNKLQFEVVSLRSEIDKLKKIVKNVQKNVDSSFISPLSVSSLGTLDLSIDENVINGITCDELCDFNKELNEIRSKGTSFNTDLIDDSNFELSSDYYDNICNDTNKPNTINATNTMNKSNKSIDLNSSIESINYLKSIFGYELVEENNNNNANAISNKKYNYDDLQVNRIIKDDTSSIGSSKKRSLSVSDVNWVGLTKKFIFG